MCWGHFLIKLHALGMPKGLQLFKKQITTQVPTVVIVKFLRTVFYRTPLVAASESPTIAQQSQLGCLFYDFTPP